MILRFSQNSIMRFGQSCCQPKTGSMNWGTKDEFILFGPYKESILEHLILNSQGF